MNRSLWMAGAVAALLLAGCTDRYDYQGPPPPGAYHEVDYEFLDEVLFAYDSADLSPRAADKIADAVDDIRRHPHWLIEVDGFTDTVGSQDYNLPLSRARAQSVADELIKEGIDPRRIAVRGFGKQHLAVPTDDNVRERRNRRVVIRLLPPRY